MSCDSENLLINFHYNGRCVKDTPPLFNYIHGWDYFTTPPHTNHQYKAYNLCNTYTPLSNNNPIETLFTKSELNNIWYESAISKFIDTFIPVKYKTQLQVFNPLYEDIKPYSQLELRAFSQPMLPPVPCGFNTMVLNPRITTYKKTKKSSQRANKPYNRRRSTRLKTCTNA
jgi:hypothetical protein